MTKELDNTKETFYAARSGKSIFLVFLLTNEEIYQAKGFFMQQAL